MTAKEENVREVGWKERPAPAASATDTTDGPTEIPRVGARVV
jgi:hypothetical protein